MNPISTSIRLALLAAFILLPSSFLLSQGPLTPPPGAPAPTMKTLDQVEPRVNLQATPLPAGVTTDAINEFIIVASGSYYLSANLTVTKAQGIRINVEGVTLDLNGFEISRASVTGTGIQITAAAHRATVRNGSIKRFSAGIESTFSGASATGCAFRDLSVSGCNGNFGINAGPGAVLAACRVHDNNGSETRGILAGFGSSLSNCTAHNNTGNGISAGSGSSLNNCTAYNNGGQNGISAGSGSSLSNCTASNNTGTTAGILAFDSSFSNCTSSNNTGDGFFAQNASTLANCTASVNGGRGIFAGTGSTLTNCTARSNTGHGIDTAAHTISRCTASENGGNGIKVSSAANIDACSVLQNDGNGILVGDACLISNCVVNHNGKRTAAPVNAASDGIEIGPRSRIVDCTIFDNAQHGIHSTSTGNRNYIEGCLLHSNDAFGIFLQGNGNTVIKNQVGGNTGGGINQSGGNIAPTQNASDAVGTIHPLANFQ